MNTLALKSTFKTSCICCAVLNLNTFKSNSLAISYNNLDEFNQSKEPQELIEIARQISLQLGA